MALIFRVDLTVQDGHWAFSHYFFLQIVLRRTTANSCFAFWKVVVQCPFTKEKGRKDAERQHIHTQWSVQEAQSSDAPT